MNNNRRPYYLLLAAILFVGFILRFWNFWNIPFMFDELSAMGRTTYHTFEDLIMFGVVERDSHPAGIQVFLYYWSCLFGDSEQLIKLPFLLAGVASIWVAYKIGLLWFNQTTGIITAACIASLQLFVMYSQIARPYVSGLIFTLAMVHYWSKYFFTRAKLSFLVGFVIFASLAAYNHYFSLLFAATVGLSGLLFVNRKNALPYIWSGVVIVVLYLPHLQILFAQAEKGTIGGWLGEPGPYFLFEFLFWLFHHSIWAIVVILLIIIFGLVIGIPGTGSTMLLKKRLVLFLWLLPAPVFGYVYSYTVEPILQYSLLIFSTPYLMILVFSLIKNIEIRKLSVVVFILLTVNILSLIYSREYYKVFYNQPFEQVVKQALKLEGGYPGNVFILNDYTPYYSDYYFRKYGKEVPYFTIRNKDLDIGQFDSVVKNIDRDIVITSGIPNNYLQVVKEHFPYWLGYEAGFNYEHYTFSNRLIEGLSVFMQQKIAFTDFEDNTGSWAYSKDNIGFDSISQHAVYNLFAQNEWGPKVIVELDSVAKNGNVIIDIAVELFPLNANNDFLIVCEVKNKQKQIAWRGYNSTVFNLKPREWQQVYFSFDTQDELGTDLTLNGNIVSIYLWNNNKNDFLIKKIEISSHPGNPYRYAL